MKLIIKWFEYPKTSISGGWSRTARHRPKPVEKSVDIDENDFKFSGKSIHFNGIRKLKCNIWTEFGQQIRNDYTEIKHEIK